MKKLLSICMILFAASLITTGCKKDNVNKVERKGDNNLSFFYYSLNGDGNSEILKYNFRNDKSELYYSFKKEMIIAMSFSENNKIGFILTADKITSIGENPSIENIKLYKITSDTSAPLLEKKLGTALQLFTLRTDEDNFKLIIHKIDPRITNYCNETSVVYNNFGKEVVNKVSTFDITKTGFPPPPEKKVKTNSPDKRFYIYFNGKGKNQLAIKDTISGKRGIVSELMFPFLKAEWTKDSKYLIYSLNKQDGKEPNLFVYSIEDEKIIHKITTNKLLSYFVIGQYLIYNSQENGSNLITVTKIGENDTAFTLKGKIN